MSIEKFSSLTKTMIKHLMHNHYLGGWMTMSTVPGGMYFQQAMKKETLPLEVCLTEAIMLKHGNSSFVKTESIMDGHVKVISEEYITEILITVDHGGYKASVEFFSRPGGDPYLLQRADILWQDDDNFHIKAFNGSTDLQFESKLIDGQVHIAKMKCGDGSSRVIHNKNVSTETTVDNKTIKHFVEKDKEGLVIRHLKIGTKMDEIIANDRVIKHEIDGQTLKQINFNPDKGHITGFKQNGYNDLIIRGNTRGNEVHLEVWPAGSPAVKKTFIKYNKEELA